MSILLPQPSAIADLLAAGAAAAPHSGMADALRTRIIKQCKRQQAVSDYERSLDTAAVAAHHKVSAKSVRRWVAAAHGGSNLADAPRSGRPHVMTTEDEVNLLNIISDEATGSIRKAAAVLAAGGTHVGRMTVLRTLVGASHSFRTIRRVPELTAAHRAARIVFSQKHAQLDWNGVMFSDSKYFTLSGGGRRRGKWQHSDLPRPTAGKRKHEAALHVYMGVTAYGATRLIKVTGGSTPNQKYRHPQTNTLHKGLCAQEYRDVVLPALLSDGNELFANRHRRSWTFQQDGAKVHTPAQCLEYAHEHAPGGVLQPWPANSPDLSWIENIWAWMDARLCEMPRCRNVGELWVALNEIRGSLTPSMLQPYVDSMQKRLKLCIELDGAAVK